MDGFIFAAVLFAAACHAGWNAVIKIGLDPLWTTTLISIGAAAMALVLIPLVGLPAAKGWPWLAASLPVHLVYFTALAESYRTGDMGQVYPIARGSAPLMTAAMSTLVVGEHLSLIGWAGILALVAGVLLLSLRGGRDLAKLDRRAIGFALLTAMTICAYSLVDGIGSRASGDPNTYSLALFVGLALVMGPYTLWRRGSGALPQVVRYWPSALAGGTLQLVSYGIVIWAMAASSIAMVAALRETSVLFATAIAVFVLKEPLPLVRILAAALIVCGLAMIRLQ
ncbi:MAG TPA: EamA family transporter [Pseudolabrys sp.]|nr:EamA family transporter [Pseudolabrys sp.]